MSVVVVVVVEVEVSADAAAGGAAAVESCAEAVELNVHVAAMARSTRSLQMRGNRDLLNQECFMQECFMPVSIAPRCVADSHRIRGACLLKDLDFGYAQLSSI